MISADDSSPNNAPAAEDDPTGGGTAAAGDGGRSLVSRWKSQLISHEDPFHVHKTLGRACLLSFSWRVCMPGENDFGFANHPHLTLPTILLHLSLTLSSLVFRIPAKRIKSGDRIWPEFRLHAVVFTSRSLAIMALYYYELMFREEPNFHANFAIVTVTLIAADLCSWSVGENSGAEAAAIG